MKNSETERRQQRELKFDVEQVLDELTASNGAATNGHSVQRDRSLDELLKMAPIRERLETYRQEKELRQAELLAHIQHKRREYVDQLCSVASA